MILAGKKGNNISAQDHNHSPPNKFKYIASSAVVGPQ